MWVGCRFRAGDSTRSRAPGTSRSGVGDGGPAVSREATIEISERVCTVFCVNDLVITSARVLFELMTRLVSLTQP